MLDDVLHAVEGNLGLPHGGHDEEVVDDRRRVGRVRRVGGHVGHKVAVEREWVELEDAERG